MFLIDPFAGDVFRKRRNFIRELRKRIKPVTNLFGATQRRRRLATSLASENFLDTSLDVDSSRVRLGGDRVGNLDLDFRRKTLAWVVARK